MKTPQNNPFEGKVKCHECKCWLDKDDAQRVEFTMYPFTRISYFCGAHRQLYNRHVSSLETNSPDRYYAEVRVTEDGTPWRYKKEKDE